MRGVLAFGLMITVTTQLHAQARKPRDPGIYPVLVVHPFDDARQAYVLACAKVVRGKKPVMLSAKACAPLLAKVPLEAIFENGRTRVKITGRGADYPCPEGNKKQPFVKLSGLPEEMSSRDPFVVGVGESEREVDPVVMEALAKKLGPKISKRSGPDSWSASIVVDLDGDGVDEIVVENLGQYWLYRADGKELGTVGCEFG